MADPVPCPRCSSPTSFAGFVSAPAQTIYYCAQCDQHHWSAGTPPFSARPDKPASAAVPRPAVQPQPQQQQQAKLEEDE
jgi:hypothetical protein